MNGFNPLGGFFESLFTVFGVLIGLIVAILLCWLVDMNPWFIILFLFGGGFLGNRLLESFDD